MTSSDFFSTLAKFVKEFSDTKGVVERIQSQEARTSAAAAAKERKLLQQQEKLQLQLEGQPQDTQDSVSQSQKGDGKGDGDGEKTSESDARQVLREMELTGIVIPRLGKKSKSSLNLSGSSKNKATGTLEVENYSEGTS